MKRLLFTVALLCVGCTTSKGDSLVVVTVDAVPPLSGVALLHTISMAGGESITHDLLAGAAPFSLGGGMTKTFGVQVPYSITGSFAIHVEGRDAAGNALGQGDGSTTISLGKRVDIDIVLGATALDGGGDGGDGGGGGGDGSSDGGELPQITSEAVWIGSGGSAASATQELNLSIGGTDTVGISSATSGAQLGAGFFTSQTY